MQEQELKDKLHQIFSVLRQTNHQDYPHSAVLVPLIVEKGELAVLFEVRSAALNWQPGDICFPGGRIEAGDAAPVAAAIRETSEELGLAVKNITVLGALDKIIANIGVVVYPFVGYLTSIDKSQLNTQEVAEVFTVPLSFLLTTEPVTAHMNMATKPMDGFPFELLPSDYPRDWKVRTSYCVSFYQYGRYVIWGLTAQILRDFLEAYREELLVLSAACQS